MRGVKKKQKNFQNNYIFLILIKIILICSIKKSIFLNKDLNFFVRTRFSFSIYNTLFFVNTIFFYNFFNLSIFTRKFFFLKKKIKKFTKTGFNFFFKKFLRKRGVCFKKTVFNQIQVQKLYNQTDLPLLPSWVKYYQKYVNIFTKSHKTKILWRIILKRKKRQFNTQYTPTLRNWPVLKQYYKSTDWINLPPQNVTLTSWPFLYFLIYGAFFQKKKIFFQKENNLYFFKNNLFIYLGFFKILKCFFTHFSNFFILKKKKIGIVSYRLETNKIYFNLFFKKKTFFEEKFFKKTFFFLKKLFYIYIFSQNIYSRFFLSWSCLRKNFMYKDIISCPTHKQFFFFMKIVTNFKNKFNFYFLRKLHCIFKKLNIYKNILNRFKQNFKRNKAVLSIKKLQYFGEKILFLFKKFRFFFFKNFFFFPKFFSNKNYFKNLNFYGYLLFTPDSFIKKYILSKNITNIYHKYTNLLPIFFKNWKKKNKMQLKYKQSNLYSIYNWYILHIAELKFKKKIFIKVCNIRRFFLKIKFKKLYLNFKMTYRKYKYKIKKKFSFKIIFQVLMLVLCFKDTTLFINWFTITLTKLKYRFVKTFLYFLKSSLLNFFLPKIGTPNGVLGFFFDIRGKVGVTGDAKKRHTQISWGNSSYTTKNSKFSLKQGLVYTHTGVMGITVAITY